MERRQSLLLCQRLPSPSTTTRRLVLQNRPSLGLPVLVRPPPIWRVLNNPPCERLPNNETLQWAILSTQSLLRVVLCYVCLMITFTRSPKAELRRAQLRGIGRMHLKGASGFRQTVMHSSQARCFMTWVKTRPQHGALLLTNSVWVL